MELLTKKNFLVNEGETEEEEEEEEEEKEEESEEEMTDTYDE